MNFRSTISGSALLLLVTVACCTVPADAQTINGISSSTFNTSANDNGTITTPQIDDSSGTLYVTQDTNSYFSSSFYDQQVDVSNFTASFVYQYDANPNDWVGNGFTFTVQNEGANPATATSSGFGNGQVGDSDTFTPAVSVESNTFTGFGQPEGTGVVVDGDPGAFAPDNSPNPTFNNLPFNFSSGDPIEVNISYVGSSLTETLQDLNDPSQEASYTFDENLLADVGGSQSSPDAWVGFTGGTGGATSQQTISDFQFTSGNATAPAPEQSTGVAFGLLIALAVGAVILKSRKAKAIE